MEVSVWTFRHAPTTVDSAVAPVVRGNTAARVDAKIVLCLRCHVVHRVVPSRCSAAMASALM